MAKLTINFADMSDGFGVLDDGVYTAVVDAVELRENKAGTADYLNVVYKITDPERNAGKLVWDIISFSEKAMWQVLRALKAYEVPYKEVGLDFSIDDETPDGSRVYTGIRLGGETDKGVAFDGFVLNDGTVWPMTGSVVELTIEKFIDKNYDNKEKNNVTNVRLIQRGKTSADVPASGNSGERTKLM